MPETVKPSDWIINAPKGVIVPVWLIVKTYPNGSVDVRVPLKQLPKWETTEDGQTKLTMEQRPREDFL